MEKQTIKLSSLSEKALNEMLYSPNKKQNIEYFRVFDDDNVAKGFTASKNRKTQLSSEEMRKSHEYEVNKILSSNKSPQKIIFRSDNKSNNNSVKNSSEF